MKKSKITESQIVAVLKQGDAAVPVAQLVRKHGISSATYYPWRSKYAGVSVSDLKRMRELEANHKRVHRVFCERRLNLPLRTTRRVPQRLRQPLAAPATLNRVWALDFMHDTFYGGRRFRTLNVIDEVNRECLAIEIGTSIPSTRVVRVMEQQIDLHGRPSSVRLDNDPELTAETFVDWCQRHGIELRYIQPGKPDQNAYIERFNRSYREEVPSAYDFESREQVCLLIADWLRTYNEVRPHDSLGRVPPVTFLPRPNRPVESGYRVSI